MNHLLNDAAQAENIASSAPTSVFVTPVPAGATIHHVRVGVGVIVTCESHPQCILMGKRKGSHGAGRLALPGGHLELGEEWHDCASRELLEETGLVFLSQPTLECVTNTTNMDNNPNKHYVTIFMKGSVANDKEPMNLEPNKCEGWQWIPWDEVIRMDSSHLFEPMVSFINDMKKSWKQPV